MLIFLLFLISSGFMYYYFQKCQFQERELEKWRSGVKVRTEKEVVSRGTDGPISGFVNTVRDKLAGMPAPEHTPATKQASQTPALKPEPAEEQPAAAVGTSEAETASADTASAEAPAATRTRVEVAEPAPTPRKSPAPPPASATPSPTPFVSISDSKEAGRDSKVGSTGISMYNISRKSTPATHSRTGGRSADPIAAMLRGGTNSE